MTAIKNDTRGKKITLERGSFYKESTYETIKEINKKEAKIVESFVAENRKKGLRIFVAGGARSGNSELYVEAAYKLGITIGKMGFKLDFGLSSKGIMGAVAKGVLEAYKERGIIPVGKKSPINAITTDLYMAFYENDAILDQLGNIVVAQTLEERKKMLLDADFIVFAPGGIGTLDELVYDCVAMQDGMLPTKPFILFNVDGYFYHLMEYLKHISAKGFADRMPFIVVDDCYEAEIVFEILKNTYSRGMKMTELYSKVREIIYSLPFIVHQHKLNPKKSVRKIISEINLIRTKAGPKKKKLLKVAMEEEYLKKETERMYLRMVQASRDVAHQGDKLEKLMQRVQHNRNDDLILDV